MSRTFRKRTADEELQYFIDHLPSSEIEQYMLEQEADDYLSSMASHETIE